ncbi:hypothetical protein IL306_006697, partial [Fusarium sp. DS 682]
VAKVEGSSAYKTFMRRQGTYETKNGHTQVQNTNITSFWKPYTQFWKHPPTVQEVDHAAVTPLLQTLKRAAESYLGNAICFVNVALPHRERNETYQHSIVFEAIHQIGLARVNDHAYSAAKLAMTGNGVLEQTESETLVLAIDNSRYGFNLEVFFLDGWGFTKSIRDAYHSDVDDGPIAKRSFLLKRALEEITRTPFHEPSIASDLPQNIGKLVLYGDSIWDIEVRKMLEGFLSYQVILDARCNFLSAQRFQFS